MNEPCLEPPTQLVVLAVFGPVFDAGSKPVSGVGLETLAATCRTAGIPVFAIGGVTPERVPACLRAGAARVAAPTGILRSSNADAAVAAYREALRPTIAGHTFREVLP